MGNVAHSSSRIPGPQPPHHTLGPGQVCNLLAARGGSPAAGVSAFAARCVPCVFVCLQRAGSSLFTGESHPETQALFLSGLSQVEESIKPPDQGEGRQSGAQSESYQRRDARSDPSAADGRAAPAMPAPWLSCGLCLALLLPAAAATSRREGESASPGGNVAALGW